MPVLPGRVHVPVAGPSSAEACLLLCGSTNSGNAPLAFPANPHVPAVGPFAEGSAQHFISASTFDAKCKPNIVVRPGITFPLHVSS
jgi:hypothetical protein